GMYYKPRIDKEILAEHSKGLIALSGCLQGEAASRIVDGDVDGARESVAAYRDIFGKDRFLLEVQRHGIDRQTEVNGVLARFGKEFGLRLCATNDLHYVHRHDSEAHDVLLCLQTGARFNDPNRWRFSTQENFLMVWDFYNFARKNGIVVGPGRGSAAGSLVSYCLGITNLDPLEHGLIFERFLNIDRVSMPDIDCDFSVEGRERVIRYVSEKYG